MEDRNREREARRWRQFGEWVRQRRLAMKPDRWTQARLAEELTAAGHAVKREWIVQIESGSKPSEDLARAIERLLGASPAFSETPADLSELVQVLAEIALELRLSRQRQETFDEQMLELLAAVTGTRPVRGEQPSDSAPAVRAGTPR